MFFFCRRFGVFVSRGLFLSVLYLSSFGVLCVFFFARDFVFSFGREKVFFCQRFFFVLVFISNGVFSFQKVVFLIQKFFFFFQRVVFFFEEFVFFLGGCFFTVFSVYK